MKPLTVTVAFAALALLCSTVFADNWPSWRGPTGNGLCAEKNLPAEWSPSQNVAWKLPLPGPSGATPVVPDGKGDITNEASLHYWSHKKTPDVPTPVVVGDLAYLCMENGNLTVLEAKSGTEVYSEATHRQRHRASPVYADGKLYLTARDGKVHVIQAGREFKVLAVNDLGEDQSSSPAISNGTIYMRTFGHLWAIKSK